MRYVRGDAYGSNRFVSNGNGTVGDESTGLLWQQADSGAGLTWGDALKYCENLELAGVRDWRLPNAKELHSIVDYTRSPDKTDTPAIDPKFGVTSIGNEAGSKDWPFFLDEYDTRKPQKRRICCVYCFWACYEQYARVRWLD